MESTSKVSKHSLYSVKNDTVKKTEALKIPLRLMIDAKFIATCTSGNRYEWSGAGSIVNVYEIDVNELLEKRQGGRQCCGGTGYGNAIFEMV